MQTKERMITDVSVCGPDDNLAEVVASMWDNRCGALPVLDTAGRVVSIITDRDIAIALGTRNLRASDVCVHEVAPARIFTCLESDNISTALQTMVSHNVRRLPVVDEAGILVGVISIDDFLLHNETGKAGILSLEALEALKHIADHRKPGPTQDAAAVMTARA